MNPWKVLVSISAGTVYRFSTEPLAVPRAAHGDVLKFQGGLAEATLPAIGVDDARADATFPTSLLDVQALRRAGVRLAGAPAEVALIRAGADWSTRRVLLDGRVTPHGEERWQNRVRLEFGAFEQPVDKLFPPWLMTAEGFPMLPPGALGRTMPVIYGTCSDVPLVPLKQLTPGATVPFLICGSPLACGRVTVVPDGRRSAAFPKPVRAVVDAASGAAYSYVLLDAGDMQGATNFTADGVAGHAGADGRVLAGLGDVVDHAIRTYSAVPADRIDEERLSRFRPRANRIVVASQFGGAPDQTIVQTLKARYERNFPVVISWRGGRLGADYVGFDPGEPVRRHLRRGSELLDILEPVVMDGDLPYTDFAVEYDRNTVAGAFRGILRASAAQGPEYDEDCARAASRFGRSKYQTLQVPDCADGAGARAVLDWLVDQFAVQRTRVRYVATWDDFADQPVLGTFAITDARLGWAGEHFRLESVQPRLDGLCELEFLSFADSP